MALSIKERVKIAIWYETTGSVTNVQRRYRHEYQRDAPDRKTILKWHESLLERGSVNDYDYSRSPTVCTCEVKEQVVQHFRDQPTSSERAAANELSISQSSIHRVLSSAGFHPYKLQIMQELYDEDKEERKAFATVELERVAAPHRHHIEHIIFSDEAHFYLHGQVNRHNCRYWANKNPHWYREESLHSPHTTVWAGISLPYLYGPFFFDNTVNGERNLYMLLYKTNFGQNW